MKVITLLGLVGLGGILLLGACNAQTIADLQNPRTVEVVASEITFQLPPNANGFVQELGDGQAPQGDFRVSSVDLNSEPVVVRVDDSFTRWWKEQKTQTFTRVKSSKTISMKNGCDRVIFEIQGSTYNLPLFGKSYPVLKTARTACPAPTTKQST